MVKVKLIVTQNYIFILISFLLNMLNNVNTKSYPLYFNIQGAVTARRREAVAVRSPESGSEIVAR